MPEVKTFETPVEIAAKAQILAAKRKLKIIQARDDLLTFIQLLMPDPDAPDDPDRSQYQIEPHHRMLAEAVDQVHARVIKWFALAIPPQHGKSFILSRMGVAWKIGKNPGRHIIVGTYGSDFAKEIGDHVRDIVRSPIYQQIFPGVEIARDTQSKSDMKIIAHGRVGGSIRFRGRGESTTGRPADDFIIDDPYKDKQEGDSDLVRKECRDWYSAVVFSRLNVRSTVIIVHTRWNEDDLIGWICDPEHPDHDPDKAARWTYINIAAVVRDPEMAKILDLKLEPPTDPHVVRAFGTGPAAALWDDRFPLEHLAEAYENDKSIFTALYMGRPSPEEGDFFKVGMLREYKAEDLPENLTPYAASDHALTTRQDRDANCFGCVGVDERGEVWIYHDLVWDRFETDVAVDEMIELMRRHRPHVWWAERDHISKAIGPFMRTRMREEGVFCYVEESPANKDHKTRARGIQGRMAMGMVHFPAFAPWWPAARNELLKFPNGRNDDFVSFLSHIGMGLDRLAPARKPKKRDDNVIRIGSIEWVKATANVERREEKRLKARRGM